MAKLEEKLVSSVMLLNNASNRASGAEPAEQLSTMPTPQPISSSASTMDAVQNSASQNSRHVDGASSLEMRDATPVQLLEQGRASVPPFARTVFQEINEQRFERANILLNRFRTMTVYFPSSLFCRQLMLGHY